MANTKVDFIEKWDTFHNNGPFGTKMLLNTRMEGEGNMPSKIARYNDAAQEIQRLIKEAVDAGEGFRAYGSKWSLSHIAHHKDRVHFNRFMNLKMPIRKEDLQAGSAYQEENLFFLQCGNIIKEISEYLFEHGKSLKTSGASNGQTIAGAVSTGVHGSAFDFGAVPDFVVGLNLIIGTGPNDIVYLERHTQPALNDTFAAKINARVIRNDDLFNAALVGLGSFGFVHGVVIEAENLYLLKRYVKKIKIEKALKIADTLSFEDLKEEIPEENDEIGNPTRPFHYKVFINPYLHDDHYVVEAWYKKPFHQNYENPIPVIQRSLYLDLITLFIKFIGHNPKAIPKFIKLLQEQVLPEPNETVEGPLKDICWDTQHQGPAFACSVGIDHRNSSKVAQLLIDLAKKEGPIPGILGLRFVKKSEATLASTKFPVTCMLEMDGVLWKPTRKLISPEEFYKRFIQRLIDNDIPFTLHWGKNAAWNFLGLVEHMYGVEKVTTWKKLRRELLGKEMARVFSNKFLDDIGLSENINNVSTISA